jgi:hypothetical protein
MVVRELNTSWCLPHRPHSAPGIQSASDVTHSPIIPARCHNAGTTTSLLGRDIPTRRLRSALCSGCCRSFLYTQIHYYGVDPSDYGARECGCSVLFGSNSPFRDQASQLRQIDRRRAGPGHIDFKQKSRLCYTSRFMGRTYCR